MLMVSLVVGVLVLVLGLVLCRIRWGQLREPVRRMRHRVLNGRSLLLNRVHWDVVQCLSRASRCLLLLDGATNTATLDTPVHILVDLLEMSKELFILLILERLQRICLKEGHVLHDSLFVKLVLMVLQVTTLCKGLVAIVDQTVKPLCRVVDREMGSQVAFLCELPWALVTLIRLVTCVSAVVCLRLSQQPCQLYNIQKTDLEVAVLREGPFATLP